MAEFLTYYCSEHVFLSFLQHKQLWLTSLSQSNDFAEGLWMRDHWLDSFLKIKDTAEIWRLKSGAELCIELASKERMALGVCFSEEEDLLSQWRGYADDGRGYAITFHRERLEGIAKDNSINRLELTKVAYGDQDRDKINEITRKLSDAFRENMNSFAGENGFAGLGVNLDKRQEYEDAARSLFTVKNGAFHEEKEWRLFTYGNLSSFDGVKLRGTGDAISPYLPITIPTDAVERATIGPVNKTPEHVLKFALRSSGFSGTQVRQSHASYQTR